MRDKIPDAIKHFYIKCPKCKHKMIIFGVCPNCGYKDKFPRHRPPKNFFVGAEKIWEIQ